MSKIKQAFDTNPVQQQHFNLSGYDTKSGDLICFSGDKFTNPRTNYEYRVEESVGSGVYGQVVKCLDLKNQSYVAIKIIKSKEAYRKQGIEEIKILSMLRSFDNSQNMLQLISYFEFSGHLMLVFPLMGMNLYQIIQYNGHRGFHIDAVRTVLRQIVSTLSYLHEANIVHSDLKPENIVLKSTTNNSWDCEIIDYGSAFIEEHHPKFQSYFQSMFYRAPEVILGISYTRSIDMWSVGCIAAELFLGLPLFAGKNEYRQLEASRNLLGPIPDHLLNNGARTSLFYTERNKSYNTKTVSEWSIDNNKPIQPIIKYFTDTSIADIILSSPNTTNAKDSNNFVDFLLSCFEYDPTRRCTPQQASQHQFLRDETVEICNEIQQVTVDIRGQTQQKSTPCNQFVGSQFTNIKRMEWAFKQETNQQIGWL